MLLLYISKCLHSNAVGGSLIEWSTSLHVGELLGLGSSLGSKGGIAPVLAPQESSIDGIEIRLVGWLAGVLGTDLGIVLRVGLLEGLCNGLKNFLARWLVLCGTGGPVDVLAKSQAGENTYNYFSEAT